MVCFQSVETWLYMHCDEISNLPDSPQSKIIPNTLWYISCSLPACLLPMNNVRQE